VNMDYEKPIICPVDGHLCPRIFEKVEV